MLYSGTFVKSAFWISSCSFDVGFPSLLVAFLGLLLVMVHMFMHLLFNSYRFLLGLLGHRTADIQ